MADNGGNGHKEEQKKKFCPFLNEYCIEERCALSATMTQVVAGIPHKMNVCSFNATVMLLSEVNAKTHVPQQKIQLPHLLRG